MRDALFLRPLLDARLHESTVKRPTVKFSRAPECRILAILIPHDCRDADVQSHPGTRREFRRATRQQRRLQHPTVENDLALDVLLVATLDLIEDAARAFDQLNNLTATVVVVDGDEERVRWIRHLQWLQFHAATNVDVRCDIDSDCQCFDRAAAWVALDLAPEREHQRQAARW